MSALENKIQPSVKKEAVRITAGTFLCVLVMWAVFGILHMYQPETVPFDYRVILGGLGGGAVASLNFLLMGLNLQKVVQHTDEGMARAQLRASYAQRMLFQVIWAIVAIVAPCFQFVAGLLPLLFPNLVIKAIGILQFTQNK